MTSKSVGSIVSLQRGNSYKSKLLGPDGPKLLGLGSIAKDGGFKGDKLKSYSGPTDPRHLLFPGDIYVSLKDVTQSGDLLGAIAQVPENIEIGRLTQDTVKLKFEDSDFSRDYLYWALRSPQYRHYCRSRALGTTNLSLSREDFLSFEIPELTETRANIVSSLQALDDKIEVNRKTAATLEEMARALYRSWFVDFDPVHAKAAGRTPAHMNTQTADLFPDSFGEDGLPEGWNTGTLADMAQLNPSKHTKRSHPEQVEYVDLANTKWGTIESTMSYVWADAPSRARMALESGDTIVGTVRPGNGSFSYVSNDSLTGSTGFAVLRPKACRDAALVYLAATDPATIEALANLADGGAYPAVRPDVVAAQEGVLAPEVILQAFSTEVSPLIAKIEAGKNENQSLATLRDTLLPRLMSGELRVGEAKEQVETVA